MPRKLQPCGTTAAYARHRYNNEEPCVACKQANTARANDAPSGGNAEGARAYAALEANPPVIVWRRKNNGVWVAVSVQDPHSDGGRTHREARSRSYASRTIREFPVSCEQGHEFDSWNTLVSADGEPHCRTCASPQDTQLLSAARTDI